MSGFEVLTGAAAGYEIRLVPWAPGALPPHGAVVVGVSARGDPLLAATSPHLEMGQQCVSVGYTSVRDSTVTFAFGDRVRKAPW